MLYTSVKYVMYSLLSNLWPVRSSSRMPWSLTSMSLVGVSERRSERARQNAGSNRAHLLIAPSSICSHGRRRHGQ